MIINVCFEIEINHYRTIKTIQLSIVLHVFFYPIRDTNFHR